EEATDGPQALERYVLNKHDLVVLDMVMHGMYGVEVLAKLRELNPDLPVIVLTADIQKTTRDQVKAAGAAAMIHKPVKKDELISGHAMLLLDKAASVLLNRLLTDRPAAESLDDSGREVIIEVGNIVLNACLGVFVNLLHVQITFTVPHLQVDDVEHIMRSIRI